MLLSALCIPPYPGFCKKMHAATSLSREGVKRQRTGRKTIFLAMKLTAIFLLAACLQVSARGFSQKITLAEKNAPLEEVLTQIKEQSGYHLVYRQEWMEKAQTVTLDLKNASLQTALNACFANQPLTYEIVETTIVLKLKHETTESATGFSPPPPANVDGKVVNEKGEPVAGASVVIKGSSEGTSTNALGGFSLNVKAGDVLIISSVGYESREVKITPSIFANPAGNGSKYNLNIVLKPKVATIDSVEVTLNTGYQQLPKERATGSFTQINNATLNLQAGNNILDRLNGVSSSTLFDYTKNTTSNRKLNINIRGLSTING